MHNASALRRVVVGNVPTAAGRRLLPARTPLPAASDPAFERFVRLVRRQLAVPVALVSLVDEEQQVFPGAAGLPEPWQTTRRTPLTHSFCQHVVVAARPLVIEDARSDPRVEGNLAVARPHGRRADTGRRGGGGRPGGDDGRGRQRAHDARILRPAAALGRGAPDHRRALLTASAEQ